MKIGRMARWYRWIEYAAFGRALENRRFAFLSGLVAARRVLILGEGDGRTLARLLTLARSAHFDVVELSPEMIALARKGIHGSDRVTFHCKDAREMDFPAARFDAIVTHFFIDCFNEDDARRVIRRLANTLRPDGIWLIGEFAIPPAGWRRLHAQLWIWTMYRFFRATTGLRTRTLPPIGNLMRESGMQRIERETERAGLIVSEVWKPTVAHRLPGSLAGSTSDSN
ncbi:MAG: class I SAM-dependent methyltransferase [Terriglobia bacterium]